MILFPTLPDTPHLKAEATTYASLTVPELVARRSLSSPQAIFGAVGIRVGDQRLASLRNRLLEEAAICGYPGTNLHKGHQMSRRVDAAWGIALHQEFRDVLICQAFRADLWNFISMVLVPDLVLWRWRGDSALERWVAHGQANRHCFGRLWIRAFTLHEPEAEDPHHLLRSLGEDEMVQIFERPSLAGHRPLARDIAKTHLEMCQGRTRLNRADLLRNVLKVLMRKGAYIEFGLLTDEQRRDLVLRSVHQAIGGEANLLPTGN